KSLMAAKESKAAFDDFWLDLTRSSERARDIIKNYYDRVEEANRLFTTYKPGWKTDRGMIYITFGPPGKVIKSNNEETWIYLSTRDLKKIEFKFVKASSIFSNSHYALVRDKKYADAWYKAIRLIRQGRFRRD
ncbi:MAG: GWxTD domain-containing protein, partial [Bacteroidota bacterium]